MLIAIVYGVGVFVIWRLYAVLDKTAWYTVPAVASSRLSPAGMWYTFVSVPLFQFMLLRWSSFLLRALRLPGKPSGTRAEPGA